MARVKSIAISDTEHPIATGKVLSSEEIAAFRTKRVNVGHTHRASVTKSVNEIDAAVASNDAHRLRQLELFLADKLAVLEKLDDKLLGVTEESELHVEAKVEQAKEA